MITAKVASALIFKLCLSYTNEEAKLTCFDKLINCSNLASEYSITKCANQLNEKESYETYIKRVRK